MNDFKTLARDLGRRAPELARWLLGEPTSQNQQQLRYRKKGSLVILIRGADAGHWFDHDPPAGTRRGGDAIDLIAHVTGAALSDAYKRGLEFVGETVIDNAGPTSAIKSQTPREKIEAALRLWTEGRSIADTIAERYLRNRGITCALHHDLKFHPRCWNRETQQHLPAMLALMRDIGSDEACGIHRTWLLPDGSAKARLQAPKKMLGRAKGAAIKLCPDDSVTYGLGLTEGIETGLSLMSIGWRAIWAVGSAGAVENFPILGGVESLTAFADNDHGETGVRAARICATRWRSAGREASVQYPSASGNDWNDVLRGIAA